MKFLAAEPANDNVDKSVEQLEDELRLEIERSMEVSYERHL
jgi:hypothetical protein